MEAFTALLGHEGVGGGGGGIGIRRSPVNSSYKGQWREFLSQRPVARSVDVLFDLRLKQTPETPVIWEAMALITASL